MIDEREYELHQERYSEAQVLCGLLEVWPEITGVDERFDAKTRIDVFMKSDGSWDEIDFADIFRGIERFFRFSCLNQEWFDFFGFGIAKRSITEWEETVAPTLTFGSLSQFVAKRAPVIASFEPLSMIGRQCAPAGIFRGIESVAAITSRHQLLFPPSARIIDVFRGHELDCFWTQLRWMTVHAIPELPSSWRNITGITAGWGSLAAIISLLAAWDTSNFAWFAPTVMLAVSAYVISSLYKHFTNPLPPNLVTFRDLSILIANHRLSTPSNTA